MKRLKRLTHACLFPHAAVMVVLIPFAATWLIYSFAFGKSDHPATYGAYATSAYALLVLSLRTPDLIRYFRTFKQRSYYVRLLSGDPALRVKLSLYGSLAVNVAYAIFQMGLGFYHASVWFYSLAVYYVLLAVMRFFLLRYTRANATGLRLHAEWRRYRFCGIILLMMNVALSVIVFYITWQGRGFSHSPVTTIAMAAYTFTALTMAIISLIRYRRYHSPVLSAAKTISLAAAAVSMLTLESAMLAAFGDESSQAFHCILTGATGGVVCVFILLMAVYMIVRSTQHLNKKESRYESATEQQ